MADFWLKDGESMLFIGDSITDCGRRAAEAPLGNGYVKMFSDLVTARYPTRRISYINKGISGNRVTNLQDRWRDDVMFNPPDKLSIKIGINDLHSVLRNAEDNVPVDRFERIYDDILDLTAKEIGCPVLLITPFYISADRTGHTLRSKVLDMIPEYIDVVERMSRKYNTKLLNLHDIFQEHLKYRDSESFCPEPVHPHHTGHLVIANAIMEKLSV